MDGERALSLIICTFENRKELIILSFGFELKAKFLNSFVFNLRAVRTFVIGPDITI